MLEHLKQLSGEVEVKNILTGACAALVLLGSGPAQSAAVLYWADAVLGTDAMSAALAASGHSVTTASSESQFVTQVGAGGWDLVVFMNQNTTNASAQTAITSWVTAGGAAIFADWTRTATTAAAFDAVYTGGVNQTSMTVTSPALAAGMTTNPITLANPGWGVFTMSMDDVPLGGLSAAIFADSRDAIVVGNGGRTIVNGFLNDTFGSTGATFQSGVTLYSNELSLVLGAAQVPEPGTLILTTVALFGFGAARRRAVASARQ